jgi:hypothetical protein
MKSGLEIYKNKRIFVARYDHMSNAELKAEIEEVMTFMAQNPVTEDMLVLVDTTGTLVSPEVLTLFKNMSLKSTQFKPKTAILGMTGPRRVFLDIVAKFSKTPAIPFDDMASAKDWLVS